MQKMIELVHINDIVFLSGIGGIGKTELAKKFMEEMTGEYRCIFLRYEASLENTLAKIEINGLEGAEFKEKEPELKKLLNDNVVLVIDNFDFVGYVPKIVIFLDKEDQISYNMTLLLGYLHNIGIDIIIFNPSGLCNISDTINNKRFNNVRLQNINYNSNYNELMKGDKKQNVFSKLFK